MTLAILFLLTGETKSAKLRRLTTLENEFITTIDDRLHWLLYDQFKRLRHAALSSPCHGPLLVAMALNQDRYVNASSFVQEYGKARPRYLPMVSRPQIMVGPTHTVHLDGHVSQTTLIDLLRPVQISCIRISLSCLQLEKAGSSHNCPSVWIEIDTTRGLRTAIVGFLNHLMDGSALTSSTAFLAQLNFHRRGLRWRR